MDVGQLKATLTLDGKEFTLSVRQAGQLLRQLQTRFDDTGRAVDRIDRRMDSIGTQFRNFVTTLGMARFALMDLNDIFLALPSQILKTSGEIERMTQVMAGLSTATDDAGKKLDAMKGRDFIFQLAKNAPFEVKAIQDAFVKLKSGGLDPMDGTL